MVVVAGRGGLRGAVAGVANCQSANPRLSRHLRSFSTISTNNVQLQDAVIKSQPALRRLLIAADREMWRRPTILVLQIAGWGDGRTRQKITRATHEVVLSLQDWPLIDRFLAQTGLSLEPQPPQTQFPGGTRLANATAPLETLRYLLRARSATAIAAVAGDRPPPALHQLIAMNPTFPLVRLTDMSHEKLSEWSSGC